MSCFLLYYKYRILSTWLHISEVLVTYSLSLYDATIQKHKNKFSSLDRSVNRPSLICKCLPCIHGVLGSFLQGSKAARALN